MNEVYVTRKGNAAEVSLPAGVTVHVRVKTNAKATQRVRLGLVRSIMFGARW
ncbi:hypothetical protein [Streptomyces bauhiniae]